MDDSYYQSAYEGEEIDESIGKVQDIFIKKTAAIPVDVGGTGQTTIQGIKDMLGIGGGTQGDVIPISGGGTGATTAAGALKNLGALSTTGTAAAATKLATARTIRTNLGSTSTASFDGSANITPGVTGILPQANGGTGSSSLAEAIKAVIQQGGVDLVEISTTGNGNTLFTQSSTLSINYSTRNRYYLVGKAVTKAAGLHKIKVTINRSEGSAGYAGILCASANLMLAEAGRYFSTMQVNSSNVSSTSAFSEEGFTISDNTRVSDGSADQEIILQMFLEAGIGFSVWVTGHHPDSSGASSDMSTIVKEVTITYGNS